MANLGMADSLILMVMALVVFGPRRLPQIGRQIGKLMYEFRKASNDFKFQMEEEMRSAEEADRRKADEERMKALAVTAVAPKLGSPQPVATETLDAQVPPVAVAAAYPEGNGYPTGHGDASAIVEPQVSADIGSSPRIQPPSTGEPVAAARPNSPVAMATAAQEPGAAASAEPAAEMSAVAEDAAAGPRPAEPSPTEPQPPSEAVQAVPHG